MNKVRDKEGNEIDIKSLIGTNVTVTIDRPIGSVHPKYKDIIYEVNYGYIENLLSNDDEELDAYIVGETLPLDLNSTFEGKVVAILHRTNDDEDKLIVAPMGREVCDEEIINKTYFMEQYFVSEIVR